MSYSSNCPVSRPAISDVDIDADLGGLAWSDRVGLVFPVDGEVAPLKHPHLLSYRPTVR